MAHASRGARPVAHASVRSCAEPILDMGPGRSMGGASRHHSYMAAGNSIDLLVEAAAFAEDRFRRAWGSDVIALGDHCQKIGLDLSQVNCLVLHAKFVLN